MNHLYDIKIISGGQTGVDRAALDFAINNGIPCGGWCPKGRLAEDGKLPLKYPLKDEFLLWIKKYRIKTLNIAGPRESISKGIYMKTLHFFEMIFKPVEKRFTNL